MMPHFRRKLDDAVVHTVEKTHSGSHWGHLTFDLVRGLRLLRRFRSFCILDVSIHVLFLGHNCDDRQAITFNDVVFEPYSAIENLVKKGEEYACAETPGTSQ